MRCLHCNKKLSLLKLAKGDSFCSAEHFDAYQFQLSKSAYDRLLSLPDEATPRAPLIFKTPAPELEADSALLRLSAFRASEQAALPPPMGAPLREPSKAPPYAGFLPSRMPSVPPQEPAPASVPNASEPVAAPRDLAFPVHDVDATVCILNLYLRLGLSETPPRNWTRLRHSFSPPEAFLGAIAKPALAAQPCEPPEIEAIENPAPSEPAEAILLDQPADIEPVDPLPANADFIEADLVVIPQAVQTEAVEPPVAQVPIAPTDAIPVQAQPVQPARPEPKRLPFLLAPSFQEREGEPSRFDGAAGTVPQDWKLAPVLDHAHDWSALLPPPTGFSRSEFLEPKNAFGPPVQSGFAVPAAGAMHLPKDSTLESYQWQALDGPIDLARAPLTVDPAAAKAIDCAMPVPAPVLPNATLTPNIDRSQILTGSAHTLLRQVLETRPRGQQPTFRTAPVDAFGVDLPSITASFPDWEGFSSSTWENETGRLSLPTSIGNNDEKRPYLKMAWRQKDVARLPKRQPAPVQWASAIHLLAPATIDDQPVLNASALLRHLLEPAFTQPATAVFGLPDWSATVATGLLPAGEFVSRNNKIRHCSLTFNWQPCQPASQGVAIIRFLPVRRRAILPSAHAWPRLGALQQ